ncbi:peptide chain release factor 1 [Anoxybacter fermentans]|uniref:Peptide chain release factor 1 n=1 Tax=Anoxybacter fermentans TaxID=1323375 RepID=A0A3Q9HRC1_9FIRM|nr:peptide chain release factor 1 [Anoxybacter fermentans]AZR74014.1 peptide chain release factor 1 [Anoxybacter fermentans]
MENLMEKLKQIEEKYNELGQRMADPSIHKNPKEYQKIAREHASLSEIVEKYHQYRDTINGIREAKKVLSESSDPELKELAQMELKELEPLKEKLEEEIPILLLPKDPNDEKNVIMEIRAGAGGDEAGLFAADLFRMYTRYAESKGWKIEILSSNASGIGGFKEVIFIVEGQGAYSRLKYESGVHRVQRVPVTESSGRIHTSTATVAVLPEAEEVEIEIDPKDLRIDTFRSSGHGGQHVNTTDSAVRITHLPTGIVVSCQDEKSQHKNKEKAMRVLRAKLYELAKAEAQAKIDEARKSQVGTGDRSERIRTYNFPQGRVTDHRINLTVHQLDQVLDGELDQFIDALITFDQTERLKKVQ